MRPTPACAARAVRMYVPMRATGAADTTPATCRAASRATPSSDGDPASGASEVSEVATARRLTEAVLRARAGRSLPPASVYAHAEVRDGPTAPASEVQAAARLALSYGKTAFLTHVAHQHDDDVYQRPGTLSASEWDLLMVGDAEAAATAPPGRAASRTATPPVPLAESGAAGLCAAVDKNWDDLTDKARVRWITSAPQGRRALERARSLARRGGGDDDAHRDSPVDAAAPPSLETMLSKYSNALVCPRAPRAAAALAPSPPAGSTLRAKLRCTAEERGTASAAPPVARGVSSFADNVNRRHLRDRADAVRSEERRRQWNDTLVQFLGGEAAFMFAHNVKDLQQPRADVDEAPNREAGSNGSGGGGVGVGASGGRGSSSSSVGGGGGAGPAVPATTPSHDTQSVEATEQGDAAMEPSPGVLELCEGLGIGSPRRAYVLSRVLPEVDAAAASADAPLSLMEVRDLANKCSAEYDQLRGEAARTAREAGFASTADAVRAFEQEQLALAVGRVQTKLLVFQEDLPLLKNCVSVFSK